MAVSLQDRYSSLVDAKLRAAIVQKNGVVWNTRYEGSPKAGSVKVPIRDTEVKVGEYDKENGAAKTHAVGTFLQVIIDKDYAVNELIDNYDAESVPDNIVADRLDSAGYSLGLQMNSDATAELVKNGKAATSTTALTKDTIYNEFVDVRTVLSKNKVPTQNRFALVTPDVYALLLKSPEFIKASNLGDDVVQSGAVGRIAGFTVYEDVTLDGVKKGANKVEFICGHPDWCCRIQEWAVEPHVQALDQSGVYIGACAVQGRKIYAHKVTKGDAVLVKTAV